jgi:hypothetical protein
MYANNEIIRLKDSLEWSVLLLSLGFEKVNETIQRASCLLHAGSNGSSFSWNENSFFCFACNNKGDKIDLIRQVKHCTFKDAVNYLSTLTGYRVTSVYGKAKSKKVDYSKLDFPVNLAGVIARKTIRNYFDEIILNIKLEINNYTEILFSIKNENVPGLYSRVEHILNRLDENLSWWTHERNQLWKR